MKVRRSIAAATAVGTLLVVAACGGGSGGSGSAPTKVELSGKVDAPTTEVDSITWNLPNGEPTTLDPAQSALENISTVVGNTCENLMRFGPDYTIEPGLAEKVTQPDDTTYVFDLRKDATFWDGNPVTPEDVVFSIERTVADETASPWAAAYLSLESVEKTGDSQVTISFSKPTSIFAWYQATPSTAVVEKKFVEEAGDTFGTATGGIMCTGPYKVQEWKSGQDIALTRNDGYWGEKPLVKSATFTFDSDPASRTAALLRGDVDGAFENPVSSLSKLGSSDAGTLLFGQSLSPVFVSTFVNDPAIANEDVRAALAKIVDYNGIAKNVYGGAAKPIKTLTPPSTWGYAEETFQKSWDALPEATQDLAEAKQLVDDAGDVPAITLAYDNSSAEESKIALSMQSTAKQVGLTIDLRSLSSTDYYKIFYDEKAREGLSAYLVRGYLDFPEPLEYDQYATTGSYYNFSGYDNPEYDALLAQAEATLDDQARAELIVKAQKLTAADGYSIPLVTPYINVFVSKELTGLQPSQRFLYTPWLASLGGK